MTSQSDKHRTMATITEKWTLKTDHRNIVRDANGSYSHARVTASFAKTVNGTTTQSPSDGTLEYSFDGLSYAPGNSVLASDIYANGGTVVFRLTVRGSVVLTNTVSVVPASGGAVPVSYSNGQAVITVPAEVAKANDNITIILEKGTGAARMTEAAKTVTLTPAGTPGASSATLDISPSSFFIPADSNGRCRASFSKTSTVRMFVNNRQASITEFTYTKQGMSGATVSASQIPSGGVAGYAFGIRVNSGTSEESYGGFLKITVTGNVGNKSYKAFGTVSVEGNRKGDSGGSGQGAPGPMCYSTGEYSENIIYMQERGSAGNVICTPAVEVPVEGSSTSELWYLDALTNVINGTHVGPKDNNQAVWKQGLSGYNLIRTKYLFADFGNIGSFVICGDWLISQAGEYWESASVHYAVNGGTSHYTAFKGADPLGTGAEGYPCFAPNFALDGMTGKGYTKNWRFSGNIYMPLTSINASNYNTTYGTIDDDGNLRINLKNTNNSIQIESIPNTYKLKMVLPDIADADLGCEIIILNVSGGNLQFLSTSKIYTGNFNGGYVGALLLQDNEFVKLKAVKIEDAGFNLYIVIGGGSIARSGGHLPAQLQ